MRPHTTHHLRCDCRTKKEIEFIAMARNEALDEAANISLKHICQDTVPDYAGCVCEKQIASDIRRLKNQSSEKG